MPLYDFQCSAHGKFEAHRRVQGASSAPCPSCGEAAERTYSNTTFIHSRPYDQAVDGLFPTAGKPDEIERGGGGKATKVKATGGYRPTLTHHTECPKCKKMRNVAVTSKLVGGTLVSCEACAYSWIHKAEGAPSPLFEGADDKFRPAKMYHMGGGVKMRSGYEEPERGA